MSALTGLRGRLHVPGRLFFAHMVLPEPGIASVLGFSGVDFVMLDAEHGPFTLGSMRACVEALGPTPASIVVRTATAGKVEIQQLLDLGVDGVVVPHVESAEEAASIVRAARYPPEGARGIGGVVRAARYGLDAAEYFKGANSSIAVMAIIESGCGVENAAEIAAAAGLDGIMIGPTDLTADLGFGAQLDHPSVREAIDKVVACAQAEGIKVGAPGDRESMLVCCLNDAMGLATAARSAVELARGGS